MVYPEEPSLWAVLPHIPALYEDGDYSGKITNQLYSYIYIVTFSYRIKHL